MNNIKSYELNQIKSFGDERGHLISFEKDKNCPFEVKRCFYIFDTNGSNVVRGAHANRFSKFLMVALTGSCKVRVDTGRQTEEFVLDNPHNALFMDKMVWKEMYDFSSDCVLMVLSNEIYNENEYIRNYEEFKELISNSEKTILNVS